MDNENAFLEVIIDIIFLLWLSQVSNLYNKKVPKLEFKTKNDIMFSFCMSGDHISELVVEGTKKIIK